MLIMLLYLVSGDNLVLGENIGMMYNILQVTQLLWQCILALSTDEVKDNCTHNGSIIFLQVALRTDFK